MIGPAPDLGGNVTVMPYCVKCSGGANPQLPQDFENPWQPDSVVGTPVPLCPVSSCPNPNAGPQTNTMPRVAV